MENKYTLAIIAMVAIGLNFGFWQESAFAGIVAGLSTYYIFMFKYDL